MKISTLAGLTITSVTSGLRGPLLNMSDGRVISGTFFENSGNRYEDDIGEAAYAARGVDNSPYAAQELP